MGDFLQGIATTAFARGLPSEDLLRENPVIAAIFRGVIREDRVTRSYRYLVHDSKNDDEQQAAFRLILRSGWLHTEIERLVVFTFPSPLHKRCVDWMLNGSPMESKIVD